MNTRCLAFLLTASFGIGASVAAAQTASLPFQIRIDQGQTSLTVPNYSTLTMAAEAVGKPLMASVTLTYTGRTMASLTSLPVLIGSSDISIVSPLPDPPVNFAPGDNFRVQVRYSAATSRQVNSQLNFIYTEQPASRELPIVTGTMAVGFTGVAPEFSGNYALAADANIVPLGDNGVIQYPSTLVNGTATATVIIVNRGSGPGVIDSVKITGDRFQLLALPLLPTAVASGGSLQFLVRYSPTARGTDQGQLTIALGERTITASLQATAISSSFAYEMYAGADTTAIAPGQPITIPDTKLGETTNVIVQVKNNGNADGAISGIVITGAGYTLTDLPIFPLTLTPNSITSFVVNFAPAQPGRNTARMRIGNDVFDLAGTGIGAKLVYSYSAGGVTNPVTSPGFVSFTPATVGQTTALDFTMRNAGTLSANISSIGVANTAAATSAFRVAELPPLPLTLKPGESTSVTLRFTPVLTGQSTASFLVDSQAFTLSGFGTDPPPLPAYRFTGATGNVDAFDQPAIGLTLASAYPLAIKGVLTMAVDSELTTTDPSVQFAFGGRQVAFTIPANSTQAIFPNGSANLRLQTGTVASSITLTPAFFTEAGLDLTPRVPSTLRLQVAKLAPRLLSAQVTSQSATGFVLVVNGYSTTRSLSKVDVSFTATAGVQFPNAKLSVNIDQESALWFKSSGSQSYGGQFSVSIPFTLRTEGAVTLPLEKLDSLSVTVSNESGTSNAMTSKIR